MLACSWSTALNYSDGSGSCFTISCSFSQKQLPPLFAEMICKCFHVFPDVSHYLSQRRFPESTSRLFFRSLQNALDLSSFLTSSFFVFCCFIFSQKRKSMPKFGGCFATVFVTVYLCESSCDCVFVWVYLCVCVCVREREREREREIEIVEQFRSVSASYSIKDEVIGTYDVPQCEFIWVCLYVLRLSWSG